jgi:hypothetical protein
MDGPMPSAKLTCPVCLSGLTILKMHDGLWVVFVAVFGFLVEGNVKDYECHLIPESGPEIRCPACEHWIDPPDDVVVELR